MAATDQPEDLRYAETHEWVRVEGDEATIGISDHAQDELGDVVYLDLSSLSVGSQTTAGERFGEIESVKATSELFSPVTGTVVRINEALESRPDDVNHDPYGGGWMIVVKMSDSSELDKLMDAASYARFIELAGH